MAKKAQEDTLLTSAAKAIGKTAGKLAAATGIAGDAQATPAQSRRAKGKLTKKNKTRLPRRQKKAQKKKAAA